ncbi:MAG: diacylglycerol acyltransferase [Monoraphidium minutum]|nr:MAG: diacylglycerol acyltransferase [Monoraphidium minutum]
MTASFREKLPGVRPSTLVASALFVAPFLRDIGAWSGFRKVTRHTFLRALHERGAVVLCPGGQAEMCHTHRMFQKGPRTELVVHARHKGFCKIAIEHGAAVVPVLALGEALQLRNLVHMPVLQAYTTRRFRFPFPFWLGGRWGLSPLPSKVPLVYVVGKPIPPPPGAAPGGPVTPSDVDSLHAAYFASLVELYRRYRHLHPHFAAADLVLAYD